MMEWIRISKRTKQREVVRCDGDYASDGFDACDGCDHLQQHRQLLHPRLDVQEFRRAILRTNFGFKANLKRTSIILMDES